MDLQTVKEQLQSDYYKNRREFEDDINLIFQNSKAYSPDEDSEVDSTPFKNLI